MRLPQRLQFGLRLIVPTMRRNGTLRGVLAHDLRDLEQLRPETLILLQRSNNGCFPGNLVGLGVAAEWEVARGSISAR